MNGKEKKGILVIQSMGLGDVFFALPAVQVLKRQYPGEPVIFVTHERQRAILEMTPAVDKIITYARKNPAALVKFIMEIRKTNARMAVVLNPVFRGALLAWGSGAPVRTGYTRDFERQQGMYGLEKILLTHAYQPAEEKMHEVDRYLDLLKFHGLQILETDGRPRLPALDLKRVLKPQVTINLGAGWKMRQWPAERIAQTADFLADKTGAAVIFCGGESEKALAGHIRGMMKSSPEILCGRTPLKELAGVLASSDLFITPDTGTLHLAAALDVPTIALFGPGDLVKVRPRSEKVRVLRHAMPCSPCKVQYTEKCGNNLCMQEISVEEVLKTAHEMLGKPFPGFEIPASVSGTVARAKILYLQSTSEIGGTDVTLLRTLQALDKNRFEAHVVLQKDGPLVENYRKAGAQVHFVPSMRKLTSRKGAFYLLGFMLGYFPAVMAIKKIIGRENISLVHTNTIHNLYGFAAARLAGKPHVWHVREIVVQSKSIAAIEHFLVKNFSTRFLVMDNEIARPFLKKGGGFPGNIRKIYDGIDLERFKPGKPSRDLRGEIGIPSDAPLAGIVCRLDPWKGVDLFLEAAAHVHKTLPQARFWVCGGEIEGHEGYPAALHKKAVELGLEKAVYFTGWKYRAEDIADVYRSLNISVQCPVHPEPYGLANVEAMASGIPVTAFDEGGPAELCAPDSSRLVPARNTELLAQAMVEILKNPGLAASMGKNGRLRAEKLFDFRKCTAAMEKIYFEILENVT